MRHRDALILSVAAALTLAACTSPEARRTRGGGPGADVGNRGEVVQMHEGSRPYWRTPDLLARLPTQVDHSRRAETPAASPR